MRQRLGVAEILMKQARVAILDEPTSGLDPQSTHEFLDLVRSLKGEGMTILLSSHLLDLVQTICDRVALFNRGRIGLSGRVLDLMRDVLGGSHVIQVEASGAGLADRLSAIAGVTRVSSPSPTSFVVEADARRARRDRPHGDRRRRASHRPGARPCQSRRRLYPLFPGGTRCSVKAPL